MKTVWDILVALFSLLFSLLVIFLLLTGVLIQPHKKAAHDPVIVVGSGLAGLTCCLTLLEQGVSVQLIEKNTSLGGNSRKASSGVNASLSNRDEVLFAKDTLKSCGAKTYATKVDQLTKHSREAIEFLRNHGVTLDQTVMLGGHSTARTYRSQQYMAIGAEIIGQLASQLKQYTTLTITYGTTIVKTDGYSVVDQTGKIHHGSHIVFATGGFAANAAMIERFAPKFAHLPTTNNSNNVDTLMLLERAGAKLVDMDKVQIHPTGFIDPLDPTARTKVLAAGILRVVGGLLLNDNGERFCDELDTRKNIVSKMKEQHGDIFTLVVPSTAMESAGKHIHTYVKKGLLLKSKHALFPKHVVFIGKVVPCTHYTMGGVATNEAGRVIDEKGNSILNIFAAGEVTGGIHGQNRLGGNSLLECVVFGKIVAETIISEIGHKKVVKPTSTRTISYTMKEVAKT